MNTFRFVSRYSIAKIELALFDADGEPASADDPPTVEFRNYATNTVLWSRAADEESVGLYILTLSSVETSEPGLYYLLWSYETNGVPQQWRTDIEIPRQISSAYEVLPDEDRAVVNLTWVRFEDLFDSDIGGPHLKMYSQSNFGRERMAQLMRMVYGRINNRAAPHASFSMDDGNFPYQDWKGLLELLLYIESIKHLMRSYVEQPMPQGVQTARLDRRDYLQRWGDILRTEEREADEALDAFAHSVINLGKTSVLVSGGLYGRAMSPMRPTRPKMPPRSGLRW